MSVERARPHHFVPLGWVDWLPLRSARCRNCYAPRWLHPQRVTRRKRSAGDRRRMTAREAGWWEVSH